MMSQITRHELKIWWRHISVKNVGIALNVCRLFNFVIEIICIDSINVICHKIDHDLQKYRHLQMSFTYDVTDVSLRRNINELVLKIL